MQSDNWYPTCPYAASQYCLNCSGAQDASGYFPQMNYGYYRQEEDFEEFDDFDDFEDADDGFDEQDYETEYIEEDQSRSPQDIDRVLRNINKRSSKDINEIVRLGVNRRLLDYLVRSIVTYIDRNYNRYRGTLEQRIQAVERDLRRDLLWVFEIMQLLGVSPATQGRLIGSIVRLSLENLRMAPTTPSTPMPRD